MNFAMHDFNASHAEYAVGGIILSIIGFVFHKFEHKILKRLGLYWITTSNLSIYDFVSQDIFEIGWTPCKKKAFIYIID